MFWLWNCSYEHIHLNTTVMTQLEMDTFLIFFQFGAYAVSDITDVIQGVCAAVDAFVVYSLFFVNILLFYGTFSACLRATSQPLTVLPVSGCFFSIASPWTLTWL